MKSYLSCRAHTCTHTHTHSYTHTHTNTHTHTHTHTHTYTHIHGCVSSNVCLWQCTMWQESMQSYRSSVGRDAHAGVRPVLRRNGEDSFTHAKHEYQSINHSQGRTRRTYVRGFNTHCCLCDRFLRWSAHRCQHAHHAR